MPQRSHRHAQPARTPDAWAMRAVSGTLARQDLCKREVAEDMGRDPSRLSRYASGSDPIPLDAAVDFVNATQDPRLMVRACARVRIGGMVGRFELAAPEDLPVDFNPVAEAFDLHRSLAQATTAIGAAMADGHCDRREAADIAERLDVLDELLQVARAWARRKAGLEETSA